MGLVEAQDLYKRFGSLTAVDGISFKVERGEVVGFLGPNGAGKSTAMKIISGFLAPTSGQAWIDGHNSHTDAIAARRKLGYLPEGAPAYADMSVGAYLGFVAAMHGMSKAQTHDRLAELVERVHLSDVWNQRTNAAPTFVNDQPQNQDPQNNATNFAFARVSRNDSASAEAVNVDFLVAEFGTGSPYADSQRINAGERGCT